MNEWILGKEYDLSSNEGRKDVLDLIDEKRGMPNDLQAIAFSLMGAIMLNELES